MASALIPDLEITSSHRDDENDVFSVLDEDNEPYLAEISIPTIFSQVQTDDYSEVNSAWRKKSQCSDVAVIDASLIQHHDFYYYDLNPNQFSDSQKNFYNIYAEVESRYCAYKIANAKKEREAAMAIQKYWKRCKYREIFQRIRYILIKYRGSNSSAILRSVNPREADLMDRASGTFIRFRLAGETFPPIIVYKIFTKRPIVDLCERNYPVEISTYYKSRNNSNAKIVIAEKNHLTRKLLGIKDKPKNPELYQRYERVDGNDWRPFLISNSFVEKPQISEAPATPNKDITGKRAMRKRRLKLQLIKRVYENGRRKEQEQKMETARR